MRNVADKNVETREYTYTVGDLLQVGLVSLGHVMLSSRPICHSILIKYS